MARKGKQIAGKTFSGKRKIISPPESDAKSARRKTRNPSVLQFFDCAAEVAEEDDDDEEEESGDQDDDFLDDVGTDIKEDHKSGKLHQLPFLLKEEELSDEELERIVKQRYGRSSESVVYAEETKEDDIKQSLMDNTEDPTIWKVKCTVGHEREIAFCLIQKYIDLQSSGAKLQISSAFAVDHVKGYVYIEADRERDVQMACKGFRNVYASRMTRVPKNEISHLLSTQRKSMEVSKGMWVRVMSGNYKGDLAQVVAVDDAKKRATVKLVPRIDLQAIANKLAGKVSSRKATVPAPCLISSHELENLRDHIRVRRDQQTKETFEIIGGLMLKDGFLYKKLSFESLCCWDVHPSADELRKFKAPEKLAARDPFWLSALYGREIENRSVKVDRVTDEALNGRGKFFELHDLVLLKQRSFGVIIGVDNDSFQILKGDAEASEIMTVGLHRIKHRCFDKKFTAPDLHRNTVFLKDCVRILEGPFKGREGLVKHLYKGVLFIYDDNILENGGFFCAKSEWCEIIKHSHGASKENDAGSTPPGFGESVELPTVSQSPRGKRKQNFDEFGSQQGGDGDRNFFIGQALRIRVGPLKGYLCRVIDVYRSDVTVKLDSQAKVMTVSCEHLSDADAVGYKTSFRDSWQKLSDDKGKVAREDHMDAWNDKKVEDPGPEDAWVKTNSWESPSFEDKSKFVIEASTSGWDSMQVGNKDQAGGWNNSKSGSGDQASCWGTENNAGNQVDGRNDKKVGDPGPEDGWAKTDSWMVPSLENKSKFVSEASASGWGSMEVGSRDQASGWNNSEGVSGDQVRCWGTENNVGTQADAWNDKKVGDPGPEDGLAKTDSWKAPSLEDKSKIVREVSASGWGSKEAGSKDQSSGWNDSKVVSRDQACSWGTENNVGNQVDDWNDKKVGDPRPEDGGLAKTDSLKAPTFDKSKVVTEASASGWGATEVGSRDQAGGWNNGEVVSRDQASCWGTESNVGNPVHGWGKEASGSNANSCEKAAEPSTFAQVVTGDETSSWNKSEVVDKGKNVAGFQAWDTAVYCSDREKAVIETQAGSWGTAGDCWGKATVATGNDSDHSGKAVDGAKDSWETHSNFQNNGKNGNGWQENWTQPKVGPSVQGDCGDRLTSNWDKANFGSVGDQADHWTGAKDASDGQASSWKKGFDGQSGRGGWASSWEEGGTPNKAGRSRDGSDSWSRGKADVGNQESCWKKGWDAKQGGNGDRSDFHMRGKGVAWDQESNWNKDSTANEEAGGSRDKGGWNTCAERGGSRDQEDGWHKYAGRDGSDGSRDPENGWNRGRGGRGGGRRGGRGGNRDQTSDWNGSKSFDGNQSSGWNRASGRGGSRYQTNNWNESKAFDGEQSSGWNKTGGQGWRGGRGGRGGSRDQATNWKEPKAFGGDDSFDWNKAPDERDGSRGAENWNRPKAFSGGDRSGWSKPKPFGTDQSSSWNNETSGDKKSGSDGWNQSKAFDRDNSSGWNVGTTVNNGSDGDNGSGWNVGSTGGKSGSWNESKAFDRDNSSGWNAGTSNKASDGDNGSGWNVGSTGGKSGSWNESKAFDRDNSSGWNAGTSNKVSDGDNGSGWNVGSTVGKSGSWNKSKASDRDNSSGWNAGTSNKASDGDNGSGWNVGSTGGKVGSWNKSKAFDRDNSSGWNAGTSNKASDGDNGSGWNVGSTGSKAGSWNKSKAFDRDNSSSWNAGTSNKASDGDNGSSWNVGSTGGKAGSWNKSKAFDRDNSSGWNAGTSNKAFGGEKSRGWNAESGGHRDQAEGWNKSEVSEKGNLSSWNAGTADKGLDGDKVSGWDAGTADKGLDGDKVSGWDAGTADKGLDGDKVSGWDAGSGGSRDQTDSWNASKPSDRDNSSGWNAKTTDKELDGENASGWDAGSGGKGSGGAAAQGGW